MNKSNSNLVFPSCEQFLNNENNDQGKVVRRYNISQAMVEYYFIPSSKLEAYEIAKSKQDLSAHSKYGIQKRIS